MNGPRPLGWKYHERRRFLDLSAILDSRANGPDNPEDTMPSPFPGMNPYLEQTDALQDFHQSFLIHARDSLSAQVGPNYLVKVEVRLILHERATEERRCVTIADVGVTATGKLHAKAGVAVTPTSA